MLTETLMFDVILMLLVNKEQSCIRVHSGFTVIIFAI